MARGIKPSNRAAAIKRTWLRKPTKPSRLKRWRLWVTGWISSSLLGLVVIPLVVGLLAFFGGVWTANVNVQGQKEQALADFQRDQRQQHYSEILQQATRLHNAGDASTSALSAGLFGLYMQAGAAAMESSESPSLGPPATKEPGEASPGSVGGTTKPILPDVLSRIGGSYEGGSSSWQEAYTALDQAISNAEIAGDDQVIALARAMRDRYRADYYESVLKNIDAVIAKWPDPKPDKLKLADAFVGVPADRLPPAYDPTILSKSTEELTVMYADAAKRNLGIRDHDGALDSP